MTTPGGTFAHTPAEVSGWQESVFLAWWDETSGVGGVHRVGHEMGEGVANVWCGITTNDGLRFREDRDGIALRSDDRDARIATAGHTFSTEEGRLRLQVDTKDLVVDLSVEDFYPVGALWDHTADVMVARASISNHLEGSGRVRGTVTLGGRPYSVDGLGHRDQSWGPRDWSRIHSHCWVAGTAGPELSFSALCMQGADGQFIRGAGVVHQGELVTSDFDVVIHMEADGISHRGGVVTFELPDGPLILHCEPIGGFIFDQREHVEVDTLCRVTSNRRHTGFCDFEVSQGLRRPVAAALNATTVTGLSRA